MGGGGAFSLFAEVVEDVLFWEELSPVLLVGGKG
jgi:hypothetical protein